MPGGLRRWLARLRGEAWSPADAEHALVFGLLPTDSDAEIALNNLAEADFATEQTSVLTSDPLRTAALTDSPGAWGQVTPDTAIARMQALGVATADCEAVRDGLNAGKVLLVVRAERDTAAAAQELLRDQKAAPALIVAERQGG